MPRVRYPLAQPYERAVVLAQASRLDQPSDPPVAQLRNDRLHEMLSLDRRSRGRLPSRDFALMGCVHAATTPAGLAAGVNASHQSWPGVWPHA